MCLSASATVMPGSRRTNSVVMMPPAAWPGYCSRRSTSARTSAESCGNSRRRSCSPIWRMISVRWSAERPSRILAAREGSMCSTIALRRVSVGWSRTSTARCVEHIVTTVAASTSRSWFSKSARSAGGRSATAPPMPVKLSSSRSWIRSRSSFGAVTSGLLCRRQRVLGVGVSAPHLPEALQLVHYLNEARVLAQAVELVAAGEERVVLVAELHGPAHPLDAFVQLPDHGIEGGQPQRHVVVRCRGLQHPLRDQGQGLLTLAAGPEAPGQQRLHALEMRVLALHLFEQGLGLGHP